MPNDQLPDASDRDVAVYVGGKLDLPAGPRHLRITDVVVPKNGLLVLVFTEDLLQD